MFKSPVARVVMGIASVFLLVVGLMRISKGFHEIFGGRESVADQRLVQESDMALKEANELLGPANEKFTTLLTDFDAMDLADFRRDRQVIGSEVEEAFAKVKAKYQQAIEKMDQSAELNVDSNVKAYLTAKSNIYSMHLGIQQKNEEIVRLAFDESLTDPKDIVARVLEFAEQRDKIQSQAETDQIAAEELLKKL